MRILPFLPQYGPLAYAEAVLLVDDPQAEAMKLDPLLQYGMRADDQVCRAIGDLGQNGTPLGGGLLTAQQNHLEAKLFKPGMELQKVLFGEDFRGGDDGHLGIILDGQQGGHQGDHRFATADIALHQAIHRVRRHQVVLDLAEHPALGRRQPVRQQVGQRFGVAMGHLERDPRFAQHAAAAQGQA